MGARVPGAVVRVPPGAGALGAVVRVPPGVRLAVASDAPGMSPSEVLRKWWGGSVTHDRVSASPRDAPFLTFETRPARPSRRARPNRRKVLQVLMPPNRAHRTGFKVLTAAPGVVRHEPSPNSSSAGLGDIPAGAPAGAVESPCVESSSRRTTAAGGPHPKPRLTCRDPVDKRSAENRRLTDPAHNSQIRPQLTDPAHAAHPARTRHTLASDR